MLLCSGCFKLLLVLYMFDQTQVGDTLRAVSTLWPMGGKCKQQQQTSDLA